MQYFLDLFLKCFAPKFFTILYRSRVQSGTWRGASAQPRGQVAWAGSVHGAAHLSPPARPPAGAAALPAG